MDLKALGELLDLCRAKGVRRYVDHGAGLVEVEFADPAPTNEPDAAPAADPDRCACGHLSHEHGPGGLCLLGCDAGTCAPEETKPK